MGQLWSQPKPFKFLELPLVVQRQILKMSKIRDLFIFSQLSSRSYNLVRDAVVKAKCGIKLQKETVRLILQYNRKDEMVFIFGKHDYYHGVFWSIWDGKAVFNGELFDYHFHSSHPGRFYTREQDDTDAINTVFRYFSRLFHFPSYCTVFINPDFLEYFDSIELFEDYMFQIGNPKVELIQVVGEPLTGSDLVTIVDNVNCTDKILIDVPFTGRLNYHKINTLNSIQLCDGQVRKKDFLNFKSKHVYLKNIRFTEKVLLKFVKKWLRKDSNIESLILQLHENKAWKSEEEVFGWLGNTTWDPRTRGRYYKWKSPGVFLYAGKDGKLAEEWDCSEGIDIVRSDGLLATVHLTKNTFSFFVWNKRFH